MNSQCDMTFIIVKHSNKVYPNVLLIVSHLISEDNLLVKIELECIIYMYWFLRAGGVRERWAEGRLVFAWGFRLAMHAFCIQNKNFFISLQHLDIFSCPWCSSQQTKHWSACLKQDFFHLFFLKRYINKEQTGYHFWIKSVLIH